MSEWQECKLGDITSKIGSGATPTGGENSYKSEGITLIRSQNVYDFHFDIGGLAFIDEEQANLLNNVFVEGNDILMNITGESVTRCCLAPEKYLPARVNQHVSIIRPISSYADYKFVFYYLHSIKPELNSIAEIGCTRRALTKGMIEHLSILLPPLPEQRAIAGALSSLDDKIDLLHRQNKTLEGMAEAVWRKMFVEEADPGWKKGKLGDIVSVSTGKGLKRIEYDENGLYPVIGANGEIGRTDKYLTNEKLILTGRVGTLGEISISNRREVWISDNVLMIKPKEDRFFHAVYFLLKNMDFENLNVGSTQPLVTQTDLKNIEIEFPDNGVLDHFAIWCESGFNKIEKNVRQIRVLSRLRDTLLPKLMSGEVKVKL